MKILEYLLGYLKRNNEFEKLIYTDSLYEFCKEIKEIPLTKEDIKETVKVTNDFIEAKPDECDHEYKIYSKEEINQCFEESLQFILNKCFQ